MKTLSTITLALLLTSPLANANDNLGNREHNGQLNGYSKTPLYKACENNDLKMVKQIVQDKNFSVEELGKGLNDGSGYRKPLYFACKVNNAEMVKLLLAKGSEKYVNLPGYLGTTIFFETPLYWGCFNNNLEIVKSLVENGADVNQKCNYFENIPTDIANKEIREYLISKGGKERTMVQKFISKIRALLSL